MRCSSILDVRAPSSVVWDLLLDFDNYPNFVKCISKCTPHHEHRTLLGKVISARYQLSVGAFKVAFNCEHHHEPVKQCMVWSLDYTRKSDVFDSVGYWYACSQPT